MLKVRLSSPHLGPWFFRQTPDGDGRWGDITYDFAEADIDHDFLVVVDQPERSLVTSLPKGRRILVVTEPPDIFRYDADFLDQFGVILSFYRLAWTKGPVVVEQAVLPWFFGLAMNAGPLRSTLAWNDLLAPAPIKRDYEITAICSKKTLTLDQVRRLRFLDILSARLGSRLKIFGRGFLPISDKAEVLSRSRYHLALENGRLPYYWTEKLADSILGGAFPIHSGGLGPEAIFVNRAYRHIDITTPRAAADAVEALLDSNPAAEPSIRAAMDENRRRLMINANFFAVCSRLITSLGANSPSKPAEAVTTGILQSQKTWTRRLWPALRAPRRLWWSARLMLTERS